MEVITKETIYHRIDHIFTTQQEQSALQLPLSSTNDKESLLDKQLFAKISQFYHSCMSIDTINTIGLEPAFQEFRTIQHLIPITRYDLTYKQLQKAMSYLANQGIWTLFELRIESDITQPSNSAAYLWHGHVGLPDPRLYDDSRTMSVYFHAITSTIQAVFGSQDCSNEFGFNYWNALTLARRIVEFERNLVEASRFQFNKEHMEKWTLDQLQESIPMIQWNKLIKQDYVMVPGEAFVRHLRRNVFSSSSTVNPRTIQMYFIWRALWKYVDVLGDEYAAPKREWLAYISGQKKIETSPVREVVCIDLIDRTSLGLLMGRYFIQEREQEVLLAREKIKEMIEWLVQLIKEKIVDADWIVDERSRLAIIAKVVYQKKKK